MRVAAAVFFCLAFPLACLAADVPLLRADAAYSTGAGGIYEAELRLRDRHFFVLHERMTLPGARSEETSFTGNWRQTEGGALLQLTSRHGLFRRFNVGGSGDLYGDAALPDGSPAGVLLRRTKDIPRPFALAGTLAFDGQAAVLRDSASDRAFTLLPDPRLDRLAARGAACFVEADVEEDGNGALRLLRLRGVSGRVPAPPSRSPEMFARVSSGGIWRLSAVGASCASRNIAMPALVWTCSFTRLESGKGLLAIDGRDGGLRAAYEAKEGSLVFRVEAGAPESALLRMLEKVRAWDLEGDVLVLSGADGTLCILERKS